MRAMPIVALLLLGAGRMPAETDFEVTGTPIPPTLLRQNYGRIPKGISAFDLNICNVAATKAPLVSSQVFQALATQTAGVEPIGRNIMLGALIRSDSHSPLQTLSIVFTTATGIISLMGAARWGFGPTVLMSLALGSIAGEEVIGKLRPLLAGDQLEKFESQVLEPAMVLDAGSCVERTVFVVDRNQVSGKARSIAPAIPLSFHIH